MLRALLGGGGRDDSSSRSSRRRAADHDYEARSTTTTSSSSRRRRADSKRSTASAGSPSRKSTRGDDRDRGLGDVTTSRRAPPSIAGESTASTYASTYVTAEPGSYDGSDTVIVERESLYVEEDERSRTSERYRHRSESRDRGDAKERSSKEKDKGSDKDRDRDRDRDARRRERARSRSGDDLGEVSRAPPTTSTATAAGHFAAEIASPGFNQFPMQYDTIMPGAPPAPFPRFDPHVQHQFPGQFQPYRPPPNPAGEAADYYGDQGQSVATQPGVRPRPPNITVGTQPHLQTPSTVPNPPPEPSSMGQVGAAAEYYGTAASTSTSTGPSTGASDVPPSTSTPPTSATPSKPSKPGKPSKPNKPSSGAATVPAAAVAGTVTYGIGSEILNQTSSSHHPVMSGGLPAPLNNSQPAGPIPQQNGASSSSSSSHGIGAALGAAAVGAAAGYMMNSNHHHQQSSSSSHEYTAYHHHYHHSYSNSNDSYGIGLSSQSGNYNPNDNAGLYAQPSPGPPPPPTHPSGGPGPFQSGSLAFQQKQHGTLQKFIDFWRDPEGVGKFEEYTEAIGVCKYCFEPGTTSRDAPRKHHYNRRRRSPIVDRYGGSSSRVDKWSRYSASDDESRRKKSSRRSWIGGALAGGLAGYVAKSLFGSNKDSDDTHSVQSGRRLESRASDISSASSASASSVSRSVTARSRRSSERRSVSDGKLTLVREETKSSSYKASRRSSRSRSRSPSGRSCRSSGLKEAALAAAIGSVSAVSLISSRRRKSPSPERLHVKGRRKSGLSGFKYFFTAPSANQRKKRRVKKRVSGEISSSSSSSFDADLAFGSEISGPSLSSTSSKSSKSRKSGKSSKKRSGRDVDAEILELGIAARELANVSSTKKLSSRHLGSRQVQSSTTLTGADDDDDDWEDADSEDSVSSALAYGGSALFVSASSDSSSSGLLFWPWRSRSKKDKKKKRREEQQQVSPGVSEEYVAAAGSAYASSSMNSLQQVFPVPTSDPSRFDASPTGQPPVVRPGPITIQQPQPVTPVSQSVYYQTSPGTPGFTDSPTSYYTSQLGEKATRDIPHRRSNSSPVLPASPLNVAPSSILKRSSTTKESTVQFDLTEEQEDKERRADRRERKRQESRREETLRLLEEEETRRRVRKERQWEEERRLREEAEAEHAARDARRERRRRGKEDHAREKNKERDDRSSSSWVGPAAAVGAAGAVAAASVLVDKAFEDGQSQSGRSRHEERRDKRRSERRRASERDDNAAERTHNDVWQAVNDDQQKERPVAKIAGSRIIGNVSPVYDSYQEFFTPEELRHSANDRSNRSRSAKGSPNIVEVVPASERFPREMELYGEKDASESHARRPDLPWAVPLVKVIGPTPPQSQDGSVRDVQSPAVPRPAPTGGGKTEEHEEAQSSGRSTTGTRVSWGEHQTHEYEVPSPSSDKEDSVKEAVSESSHCESVLTAIREKIGDDSKTTGGFDHDPEFAATLAAAAAIAGFDPAVVTDDSKYYRRDSPPGSELPGTYRAPEVETAQDSDLNPKTQPREPSEPRHFIEGQEFSAEPERMESTLSGDTDEAVFHEAPSSIAREVIEHLNGRKSDGEERSRRIADVYERSGDDVGSVAASVPEFDKLHKTKIFESETGRSVPSAPTGGDGEEHKKSEHSRRSGDDNVLALDDSDEKREHDEKSKRDSDVHESYDDARSVAASAPGADELGDNTQSESNRRSKSGRGNLDDDNRSVPGGDDDYEHRRRRRRSKRGSGEFDETASAASSPAKIEDSREKRRSRDASGSKDKDKDQEKKSGGFLSNLFGSRSTVESSWSSSDKRDSRDVRSELGVDEHDESRRRRKKRSSGHRSSSGDGSSGALALSGDAAQSTIDSSQLDEPDERERDPEKADDGEGKDENYKSHRQRREERRRQRYEEIVESGRNTSEKEQEPAADDNREDQYDDQKQSFLEERPEMPPTTTNAEDFNKDGNVDNGGASGLFPSSEAAATGLGVIFHDQLREQDQLQQESQRPRSKSVSTVPGEKEVNLPPKARSRPPSPGPSQDLGLRSKRFSMRRMSDSPTAIPLNFRKPPSSPNFQRRQSMTSPVPTPSSPRSGRRRPSSTEFKNAREYRPLWLVERHSSGKFDAEPDGPLPSLPSSKTSSRSSSVEDVREVGEDTFHSPSLQYSDRGWGSASVGLRISTDRAPTDDTDILDSQQPTPTQNTYWQIGPPPTKRQNLKYEFHSPSELLQDPSTLHPEIPGIPSTLETLPSVESSVVDEKDVIVQPEETQNIAATKGEARASTPPSDRHGEERKQPLNTVSSFLTGPGFASVVDAAVAAAVDHGLDVDKKHEGKADEVTMLPEQTEEPKSIPIAEEIPHDVPALEQNKEVQREAVPSLERASEECGMFPGAARFAAIVDAAVAAAVEQAEVDHKQSLDIDNDETKDLPGDIQEASYGKDDIEPGERTAQEQPRELEQDPLPPSSDKNEQHFVDVVEAAVNAAKNAETREPVSLQQETSKEVTPGPEHLTMQPMEEATVDDFAPVNSASRRNKKKDKKAAKKTPSLDLDAGAADDNEQTAVPAPETVAREAPSVEPGDGEHPPKAESERAEPSLPSAEQDKEIAVTAAPVIATVEEQAPVLISSSDQKPTEIFPEQLSAVENANEEKAGVDVYTGADGQDVEATDAEAVRAMESTLAETDMRSSPTVEQPETNDGTPHMPAEPEEETWSTTTTQNKKKKGKKKRQSLASTSGANEGPEKSGESTVDQLQQPTADKAQATESQTGENDSPLDSLNQESPETTEEKQGGEDFTMTPAQKKKAKKDKKKRQSLTRNEEPASEPAQEPVEASVQPSDETVVEPAAVQEEVPLQGEQLAPDTEEQLAVSEPQPIEEKPVEETPKEEVAEFSPAKSKKKAKKDKKNRQSLGLDEEPEPQQQEPTESNAQPTDAGVEEASIGQDVSVQGEQSRSNTHDPSESAPLPAEETTKEVVEETQEDFQSAKSKKKGKKDKKKRQSLGLDEEPQPQQQEPAESIVQPNDEGAGIEEAKAGHDEVSLQGEQPASATQEQPVESESQPPEETTKEVVEDFESAKYKKKARKEKKRRYLSWDDEATTKAAQESSESIGPASDATPPVAEEVPATQGEVADKEETTAPNAHEQPTILEPQASEDSPKEDFEPADSKKPEEDKETGQSLPLDEEVPPEPAQESNEASAVENPLEIPSVKADTTTSHANEQSSQEEAVASVEPNINEPERNEEPQKDEFEEVQSVKSKKKAKKDKKKRQSLQRDEVASDKTIQQTTEASAVETETPQEAPPAGEVTVGPSQDEQAPREGSVAPEVENKEIDVAVPTEASIPQPEQTEEPPKDELEESQSAKSKKKAKKEKKKKKRQSLALDEEPTPETTEDVATSSAIDGTPQAEAPSVSQEDANDEPDTQQHRIESEPVKVEESEQPATEDQTPAAEVPPTEEPLAKDEVTVEESQTAKSKKKAKKDKKKRQSLVVDEGSTAESAKDNDEGAAETAEVPPSAEETPAAQDIDVAGSVPREESTATDSLQTKDIPDKDNLESQPPETGAQQVQAEDPGEQDGEFQSAKSKAKKREKKRQSLPWDEEPTVTSEKSEEPTESAVDTVDQTSAVEPSQALLEEVKQAEPPPEEPATGTPTAEKPAEEDAGDFQFQSAKSKKKAKKEKKKRQSLQGDEAPTQVEETTAPAIEQTKEPTIATDNPETPETGVTADESVPQTIEGAGDRESAAGAESTPAVEPAENGISTTTSEPEVITPAENESQQGTPTKPEEEFLSAKAKRKLKKKRQSLDGMEEEPAATVEAVQEDQGEKEKEAGAESIEPQEQDTGPLSEKSTTDDSQGFMSAKEKKKAKKDKKRRSVSWVDEVAEAPPEGEKATVTEQTESPATVDPAQDIVTQATSSEKDVLQDPEPHEPETAPQDTPAEADGKETFQPSDKIETDKRGKDTDWTDDMASQVEPQVEESPYPVPSPTSAEPPEPEPEISSVPTSAVADQEARETTTSDVAIESQFLAADESAEVVKDESPTEGVTAAAPSAPEQADEGDPWTCFGKKGKKEKKKRKSASSVGVIQTPEEQTALSAATEETKEPVLVDVGQEIQPPSEQGKTVVTEEKAAVGTEEPVVADGEDQSEKGQTTLLEERDNQTQPESISIEASAGVQEIPSTSGTGEAAVTTEASPNEPVVSAKDTAINGQEVGVGVSAPAESAPESDVQPLVEDEGFAPTPSGKKNKKKKKRQSLGRITENEEVPQVEEAQETKLAPVEVMEENLDSGRLVDQPVLSDVSGLVPEIRPDSTEPAAKSSLLSFQTPEYEQSAPTEATAGISEAVSKSISTSGKPQEDFSKELSGEGVGQVEDFLAGPGKKERKEKKKKGKQYTQATQAEDGSDDRGFSVEESMPTTADETTPGGGNELPAAQTADIEPATVSVSLDTFDVPESAEEQPKEFPTASAGVDMDNTGAVLAEETVSFQAQQESEERLRRRALEKEDDLAVAEDLFGERTKEMVSEKPVSRKSSKKEKKAKQKASVVEQTSQHELEVIPKTTEPTDIQAAQEPSEAASQESGAKTQSQNDEMLLTRSSSKKKGKKKRTDSQVAELGEEPVEVSVEGTAVPAEENAPVPEEHQPTKDEPSLEHEPKAAIREFEETTAAPVERASQPEEPSAEAILSAPMSKADKKKNKKRAKKEETKQKEKEAEFVAVLEEEQQSASIAELESTVPKPEEAITEDKTIFSAPQPTNQQLQSEETWSVPTEKGTKDDEEGKEEKQPLEVGAADGLLESAVAVEATAEHSTPEREGAEQEPQPEDSSKEKDQTSQSLKDDLSTSYEQDKTQHSEPEQSSRRDPTPSPMPAQQPSTSRIASIFPHLERVTFRRPSPKTIPSEIEKESPSQESVSTSQPTLDSGGIDISVEFDPSYNGSVLSDGGNGAQERAVEIHGQDESEEPTQDKKPTPPLTNKAPERDSAPSPVEAPFKARSPSILSHSTPSSRINPTLDSHRRSSTPPTRFAPPSSGGLHRTASIHGHHTGPALSWTLDDDTPSKRLPGSPPRPLLGDHADLTPPRTPLEPIHEDDRASKTPSPLILPRPGSRNSVGSVRSLRRVNRSLSSDLRAAAASRAAQDEYCKKSSTSDSNLDAWLDVGADKAGDKAKAQPAPAEPQAGWADHVSTEGSPQPPAQVRQQQTPDDRLLEQLPSSSDYDPVTDKGKRPLRGMTDVYEGWGETPHSPRSPTRPPSVRRRQSMQHLQELEARLDQLISENRLLLAAKEEAEQKLARAGAARRKSEEALNRSDADLRDKEAEIARLKSSVEWMQGEVQRLTQENEALTATNAGLTASHAREVEDLRSQHAQLAAGMEDIVRERVSSALADKDAELRRLRDELAAARQTVQELQQQIVAATADEVLGIRDEDYFESACKRLCQHVQHWVLRFSKHSDLRRCRPLAEVRDQSVADRFDNAMLDGSDVDAILADRVRRRDVFMAVVMAMIWEYIFTRYLFGMDREQRQKLKALEKQLAELGPRRAVAHWRALTLTLLSKRPSFAQQRAKDTEAVALEIMGTLSQLLPPPATAETQLLESLRGVLRKAADLAIEMRTQRAEYMMLPPLQPEYNTQGELARQVVFNASLMNERSGMTTSNEALEAQGAVVQLVLFPLVVKKGNDLGEGDEEIVVCPAQVLVARPESDRASEKDRISVGNRSVSSVMPPTDMGNMI